MANSWLTASISLTEPERRAIGALLGLGKELHEAVLPNKAAEDKPTVFEERCHHFVGRVIEEALDLLDPNHGKKAMAAQFTFDPEAFKKAERTAQEEAESTESASTVGSAAAPPEVGP